MQFTVFTIDDQIAGFAKRVGTTSSETLDGLAEYVLEQFGPEGELQADGAVFADSDGNLTFVDPRAGDHLGHARYEMTADHIYSVVHHEKDGMWTAGRRPLDGHDVALASFHSMENAVAYAEKDARGGSESRLV